jgi:hypothetical protein
LLADVRLRMSGAVFLLSPLCLHGEQEKLCTYFTCTKRSKFISIL